MHGHNPYWVARQLLASCWKAGTRQLKGKAKVTSTYKAMAGHKAAAEGQEPGS